MILEGKSVLLRPLEKRDGENLLRIAREPAIAKFMPDWSEGKERPEDYDALIVAQQAAEDGGLRAARGFAVTLPGEDALIGMVSVGENPDLNEVELTYFMSEAYKGCGYTKEAVTLLSDWCLRRPDLPYLVLLADESNASACRLAEKCGFALYEKRVTVGHRLPGMLGDVYYYYRKY